MENADRTPFGLALSTISGYVRLKDVRRRWGIAADDLEANVIIRDLDEVWRPWTNRQRLLLLDTAEAVAQAARVRTTRRLNPAARRRYHEIARLCVQSAKDALRLAKAFPPPWREGSRPVGETIRTLADFALSGLRETARGDERTAFESARLALLELERQTPRVAGHVSRQLVGRLAWLAAGKRRDLDRLYDGESVIRRLTKPRSPVVPPGASVWRAGFPNLVAVARIMSASGHPLEYRAAPAIREYLRSSPRT